MKKPTWDEYFMAIAHVVATRCSCSRRQVAAVIVKDNRIISTGYNGTPRGIKNCNEGGCRRCNSDVPHGKSLDECLCSHAEENAITQAAYHGISVKGATLYTTYSPCLMCAKMIINSGIAKVIYNEPYATSNGVALLMQAGIPTVSFDCGPDSLTSNIYRTIEQCKLNEKEHKDGND